MQNKNLPCPFTIKGECTCPKCDSNRLALIEKLIEAYKLSEHGEIIANKNMIIDSKITCMDCNAEFEYIKKGVRFIPITDEDKQHAIEAEAVVLKQIASNSINPFTGK